MADKEKFEAVGGRTNGETVFSAVISLHRGDIVGSLVSARDLFPAGESYWRLDSEVGLRSERPDVASQGGDTGTVMVVRRDGYLWVGNYNQNSRPGDDDSHATYMTITSREDGCPEVNFQAGRRGEQNIHVCYTIGDQEVGVSVFRPVGESGAMMLLYTGDDRMLSYTGIDGYTPAQEALVLQDDRPQINLSKVMFQALITGDWRGSLFPLPELSFRTRSYYYDPANRARTYPIGEKKEVVAGDEVRGVTLVQSIDSIDTPYRVTVKVEEISMIRDDRDATGSGEAVEVIGKATVDDGVETVEKMVRFVVRCSAQGMDSEMAVGGAFAAWRASV